ncbi:MAG: diaminopimelate epimerase [Actinobacteria bacterium]|uniref:diaminopimelate epimerase n=1 Tax=freshwater metagenome TaxID=449393 RepID=A0A6J7JNT3_9ZZZZ|nr:diaminopimelate epimerase [Actinomycetota bacterium]
MGQPPLLLKGHATGNDFVLLPDPEARFDVTPAQVRALCDRRTGVGGDGLLRVVPTALCPEVAEQAPEAPWFMDYRNADGSTAEMCGNGIRLFARYLVNSGLAVPGAMTVATRGGPHPMVVPEAGDVTVALAPATGPLLRAMPVVSVGDNSWNATAVTCPNPHAVVFVESLGDAGDLMSAPLVTPDSMFPAGVNVEFVVRVAPGHVRMRVHERGVGETLSCGTGAVAVAWAARRADEADGLESPHSFQVDVPGGTLWVIERADGTLELTGPAVVVAELRPSDLWWAALSVR